jgi:hypothetical protein
MRTAMQLADRIVAGRGRQAKEQNRALEHHNREKKELIQLRLTRSYV